MDEAASLDLGPTETAEIDLPPGRHSLRLLGVAGHCAVTPANPFEVDVAAGSTTPVAYEVQCPLTGARITVRTTGKDLDVDGYFVEVDGTGRGVVAAYAILVVRLDPGSRTIALTGLAPNCTVDGPASRTVTIVDHEAVPIEFAVVCTGTRTLRLTISNQTYPDLGYTSVQVTLDEEVQDPIKVPTGSSTFFFGGLKRGLVSVQAQVYDYHISGWVHCHNTESPGSYVEPVSTSKADTTTVELEIWTTRHCHFL